MSDVPLPRPLVGQILDRLELDGPPPATAEGLDRLYRAWCRRVPFDNLRKRIALIRDAPGPLPGGDPVDFFTAWLEHGTGGTCWPTSNALHALLTACGFAARRASASMREIGIPNHGTVIVRIDGRDAIVDSSMLFEAAVPIAPGEVYERDDPLNPVRSEPADGAWRVTFAPPMTPGTMTFRTLEEPVSHVFYLERYEASRELGPFNAALYARANRDGAVVTFIGPERFEKRAGGIRSETVAPEALAQALGDEFGYSAAILDEFLQCEAAARAAT